MKSDDRAGRGGVGKLIQNHRCVVWRGVAPQQFSANQLVHGQIGLMQPEAPYPGGHQPMFGQMLGHVFGRHRAHFLEDFAPFLVKKLIPVFRVAVFAARHIAGVVAYAVGEGGQQACAKDFKRAGGGVLKPLNQDGGTDVTKDEMAIPVFPGQMGRGDFRIHHQDGPGRAGFNGVDRHFNGEGGR